MARRIRQVTVASIVAVEFVVVSVGATRESPASPTRWDPRLAFVDPRAPFEQTLAAAAVWALIAIGCWIAFTGVIYTAATLTGRTNAASHIGRITPRIVRRLADRAAAMSLSFALLGGFGPAAATDGSGRAPSTPEHHGTTEIPHPGIERLTRRAEAAAAETHEPLTATERTEHVVVRGDNLWRIASAHLAAHPTASVRLRDYWIRVIESNRGRIRSGDPNLIFPGEVIVLPALPKTP